MIGLYCCSLHWSLSPYYYCLRYVLTPTLLILMLGPCMGYSKHNIGLWYKHVTSIFGFWSMQILLKILIPREETLQAFHDLEVGSWNAQNCCNNMTVRTQISNNIYLYDVCMFLTSVSVSLPNTFQFSYIFILQQI